MVLCLFGIEGSQLVVDEHSKSVSHTQKKAKSHKISSEAISKKIQTVLRKFFGGIHNVTIELEISRMHTINMKTSVQVTSPNDQLQDFMVMGSN